MMTTLRLTTDHAQRTPPTPLARPSTSEKTLHPSRPKMQNEPNRHPSVTCGLALYPLPSLRASVPSCLLPLFTKRTHFARRASPQASSFQVFTFSAESLATTNWQLATLISSPSSSSPSPLPRSHSHPAASSHRPPSGGTSNRCARCGR